MLPDPKKVAEFLNRTLFKSPEQRREEKQIDRQVRIRLGLTRLRRHINRQHELQQRLRALAKRALALNDTVRFRQIGGQILQTEKAIERWEKFLLSLELLEARRDQLAATLELSESLKAISQSLGEAVQPERWSELQNELEHNLARAASVEERLEMMMEALDGVLSGEIAGDEAGLSQLENELADQIAAEEARQFDPELEENLQRIRQELQSKEH